ncbi:hypothetical protein Terro_3028 [Terriglobus roseus DSM 18391]|uniref:Uncharacterized protein n=1 Tax=Terriglobus roseus (strain DSM 18391 / NRRL B-41598 / KBS 63) TaxID=926566 RepID=I3ZJ42_TERRK|nr:hypothetical protein Terro_3028 [Terriglobus roseus DSM 18391]
MSLPLGALLLALAGCGGTGPGTATPVSPIAPQPPAVQGQVVIAAPGDGTKVTALPLILRVTLSAGATTTNTAISINGHDVTAKLAATVTGGIYEGLVASEDVYVGVNRIKAVTGAVTARSTFNYDPFVADFKSPEVVTANSIGQPVSDVVGIQTRVKQNGTFQIYIGKKAYGVQDSNHNSTDLNGFQVLLLRRTDLSLVSNTFYQIDGTLDQTTQFANDIDPSTAKFTAESKCGLEGCVLIIQSLQAWNGKHKCDFNTAGPSDSTCGSLQEALLHIGGTNTLLLNQINPADVGYSFVGNVGSSVLKPGLNYERVACASLVDGCISNYYVPSTAIPNFADGIGPTLRGTGYVGAKTIPASGDLPALPVQEAGIRGEFILDNHDNYTFTYADPPVRFAMGLTTYADGSISKQRSTVELSVSAKSPSPFPDGTSSVSVGSATLVENTNNRAVSGGFHLVAFDATTFRNLLNGTYSTDPGLCQSNKCTSTDGGTISPLAQLTSDIYSLNSRRAIFFLQSVGSLRHECDQNYVKTPTGHCQSGDLTKGSFPFQDTWDKAAQAVQDIGGDYALFDSLSHPSYRYNAFDATISQQKVVADGGLEDDYHLVGQWWMSGNNTANPLGVEESSHINRETIAGGGPSRMSGLLKKENDGYYRASMETQYGNFFPNSSLTFLAAPLTPSVEWPLTGTSGTSGQTAAYRFISQQLLLCQQSCSDLRLAYSNLNQNPAIWFARLQAMRGPTDCTADSCTQGFTADDFTAAKQQILLELQYLGNLREYQTNLLNLLQAQESNQSLILQQEADAILGSTQGPIATKTVAANNWRTWAGDALKTMGPVLQLGALSLGATTDVVVPGALIPAAGVAAALGVATLDLSASSTTKPDGVPIAQQDKDLIAVSHLAGNLADQYTQILGTVGHNFKRITADWGRLSALGSSLANNSQPWDSTANQNLLTAFDRTARRQFVQTLLPAAFSITHHTYSSPGINPNYGGIFTPSDSTCGMAGWIADRQSNRNNSANQPSGTYMFTFIPGAPIDGIGTPSNTINKWPFDNWWDVWMLTPGKGASGCTPDGIANSFFEDTGLFIPVSADNSNSLGLYKPFVFQRFPNVIESRDGQNARDAYEKAFEGASYDSSDYPFLIPDGAFPNDPSNY